MADPIQLAPASIHGASVAAPQSAWNLVHARQNLARIRGGGAVAVSVVQLDLAGEYESMVTEVEIPPAASGMADNHLRPWRLPNLG